MLVAWLCIELWLVATSATALGQTLRLELIPPSPVTDKIALDLRGAVENVSARPLDLRAALYLDRENAAGLLDAKTLHVAAHTSAGIYSQRSTTGLVGSHRVLLVVECAGRKLRAERALEVISSATASTRTIDGAWAGIVHWSEEEGVHWNPVLRTLGDEDWREQIRGMHGLGMDTVVIQETFRNEKYYGRHRIPQTGYKGLAYYPSSLVTGRVKMAMTDPIETILDEAGRLGMHVFLGVGLYAWFDFSADSLAWHKRVARELWRRYGRHSSFYGWYVSEETYGNLVPDQGERAKLRYRRELELFFAGLQAQCRRLAPEKPILFAPNTFGLRESHEAWEPILRHVDILCPFGFQRMPADDFTATEAVATWNKICRLSRTHLWMDMEAFDFDGKALVPREVASMITELRAHPEFEKILCYQYPGLFNAPETHVKPGGEPTVRLYLVYREYLKAERTARSLAEQR
jgi:hypothetical protein